MVRSAVPKYPPPKYRLYCCSKEESFMPAHLSKEEIVTLKVLAEKGLKEPVNRNIK